MRSAVGGPLALLAVAAVACDGSPAGIDAVPDAGTLDAGIDGGGVDSGSEVDAPAPGVGDAGSPSLRVLFVGNSYTFYNDLPQVVAALAATTPGGAMEVESVTAGGAGLCDHLDMGVARDRIVNGGFHAVVLQGQSLEPFTDFDSFDICGNALGLAARDAGVDRVWFATWARRAGDPFYDRGGPRNPAEMTLYLEEAYRRLAEYSGGFLARVGAGWELTLAEFPSVPLHMEDGSHPTPAGTLTAACTLVQAITGERPTVPDPVPLGLPRETAETLCEIATRVPCREDLRLCSGSCIPVRFDPENCGDCDVVCEGARECWFGACECTAAHVAPTTFTELAAHEPRCRGDEDAGGPYCAAAIHAFCASRPCATSGLGPPYVGEDGATYVTCVDGDVVSTRYGELAALIPGCDGISERRGPACTSAIHRACMARGAVSGFGPVSSTDGDELRMTCVTGGELLAFTYETLAVFDPRCDGVEVRRGAACENAVRRICRRMSRVTGFGPVEIGPAAFDPSLELVQFVCLDAR